MSKTNPLSTLTLAPLLDRQPNQLIHTSIVTR
jgi:hypothetical protein